MKRNEMPTGGSPGYQSGHRGMVLEVGKAINSMKDQRKKKKVCGRGVAT